MYHAQHVRTQFYHEFETHFYLCNLQVGFRARESDRPAAADVRSILHGHGSSSSKAAALRLTRAIVGIAAYGDVSSAVSTLVSGDGGPAEDGVHRREDNAL